MPKLGEVVLGEEQIEGSIFSMGEGRHGEGGKLRSRKCPNVQCEEFHRKRLDGFGQVEDWRTISLII